MANTYPRYSIQAGGDQTGSSINLEYKTAAYAPLINVVPQAYRSTYTIQLSGNCTVNIDTQYCFADDELHLVLIAGSSSRVVSFGTNTSGGSTTVPANGASVVLMKFNGVAYVLVNSSRLGAESLILVPADATSINGDLGDKTNRFQASTYQQTSPTRPYGDLIRLVAEHGSAKGGIKFYARGKPARVISSRAEPFSVTTGQTLIVKINGGPSRTITFQAGTDQTFTSGAATADQISNIITKQLNFTSYPSGEVDPAYYAQSIGYVSQSGTSVNEDAMKIAIFSCTYGPSSAIEITGGTAVSALGFRIGKYTGAAGAIDLGDGKDLADQLAWMIAHHFPNDPASNNSHQHLSLEVPDSSGDMQTRLSIAFWKDVTEILISSALLIINGYPLTIANDAEANKDLDFSRDNTGRKIARRFQVRVGAESTGANADFRVLDDAGNATSLLLFNRLNKYAVLGGALQLKIRSATNNTAATLSLSPQNGNIFVISGTTNPISYMAYAQNVANGWTWQAGSTITLILQDAASLKHNGAAPIAGLSGPLCLKGSVDFTSGVKGSAHTFVYEGGSPYNNRWMEISRVVY